MSGIHPRHPDPVIPPVAAPAERDEPVSGSLPVVRPSFRAACQKPPLPTLDEKTLSSFTS
jgi:hypothetical protein